MRVRHSVLSIRICSGKHKQDGGWWCVIGYISHLTNADWAKDMGPASYTSLCHMAQRPSL